MRKQQNTIKLKCSKQKIKQNSIQAEESIKDGFTKKTDNLGIQKPIKEDINLRYFETC